MEIFKNLTQIKHLKKVLFDIISLTKITNVIFEEKRKSYKRDWVFWYSMKVFLFLTILEK